MNIFKYLHNKIVKNNKTGGSMYWKVEDKKWMKEREQLWSELQACLLEIGVFSKTELKLVEAYFLTGKRKQDSNKFEVVNLMFSLAWHPSKDPNVWIEEFERIKEQVYDKDRMISCIQQSYTQLRDYDLDYQLKSVTKHVPSIYLGEEQLLYEFFFKNETFLHLDVVRQADKAKQVALLHLKNRTLLYPDFTWLNQFKPYYNTFSAYFITDLAPYLTTQYFNKKFKKARSEESLKEGINACTVIVDNLDSYDDEFKKLVIVWVKMFESDNIDAEWKEFWKNAKNGLYKPENAIEESKTQQNTDNETSNINECQHHELIAGLIDLGYECETTDDVHELLLNIFEESAETLFDIENETVSPPYEGILDPLKLLVNKRQQEDKIEYTDNEFLKVSLNGKPFGSINLEDLLEESTNEYFQSVFELAKSWFPDQTFLYVDEGMIVLFILPKNVLSLLNKHGYNSALGF